MEQIEQTRSGHVVIGVDTHKHIHVAAVMDSVGGIIATKTIATDTGGFRQLVDWGSEFGQIIAFGIEGTGSDGGAFTSYVRRHGHKVIEVSRPDRRLRRLNGKSDTLHAENAARAVLGCGDLHLNDEGALGILLPPVKRQRLGRRKKRASSLRIPSLNLVLWATILF